MTLPLAPDTIVAISTPPGRGGIGIVRLSGPSALAIATSLVRLGRPLAHAEARFARVLDPRSGAGHPPYPPIDEAIVTAFLRPESYTGDDVVEIAAHGSPVVLDAILSAALARGARLAAPGEFTQRAFLAGRLDLTQAEAVHDLIAAQTLEQARAAAQQLGGALSRRIAPAKESLVQLIALLEAGMDFASGELDDVDVVPGAQIAAALAETQRPLEALAASFRGGALLRQGVTLALIGRPNAGKSSLFNRLLQRPRAIVTALPGTTRDTVEETWSFHGIPVRLVDTAGLRLTGELPADEAEQQGIARSREALADADIVLLVQDATAPLTPEEQGLAVSLEDRPFLVVRNKVDLLPRKGASATLNFPEQSAEGDSGPLSSPRAPAAAEHPATAQAVAVSALTGEGLDYLHEALLSRLHLATTLGEAGALNNRRQQTSITAALDSLAAAKRANAAGLPHEVLLIDLHEALRALDTLTGITSTEDILARIFSTFCIGK